MRVVFLTALGIGGATVIGSLIGFLIRSPSPRKSKMILSFSAGVMLAAAILGLILPSVEEGNAVSLAVAIVGILCGALSMSLAGRLEPFFFRLAGLRERQSGRSGQVLLFVFAIALHNFPEGLAAGVSFGTENAAHTLAVAGGIALQNLPEGAVIIAPMLAIGMRRRRVLLIAVATGMIEVIGTLLGYLAVHQASAVLPFFLAFAGGTMLYVITGKMISSSEGLEEDGATYSLLGGFVLMLCFDFFL